MTQKIIPFLTFHGNAEQAMRFYAAHLPNAAIESLTHFENTPYGDDGKVLNGVLTLMGEKIFFMDMQQAAECPPFSWALSLYVDCNSENEFDTFFTALSQNGFVMMGPEPVLQLRKVAWVTDRFGLTWQLIWA